jgi:hypothetical protein
MKKLLTITIILCLLSAAQGQSFSFQLFFADAQGNRDTIILGTDDLATDTIDTALGEVNIIGLPIDSGLDIRITDEWRNRNWNQIPGTFHTKKQLIGNCANPSPYPIQVIDIHTKHWPVTMTWDSSLFKDVCNDGSLVTSINPGGWWDTGSPSNLGRQFLSENNSVTFSSNIGGQYFNDNYGYIKNQDTIPVFWQFITNYAGVISTKTPAMPDNYLQVFPNPTTSLLSVQVPVQFGSVERIDIFSAVGQWVMSTQKTAEIDCSTFANGLYFIRVSNNTGDQLWTRMVKR